MSVSNLYNRSPGLLEPTFCFLGVTDGAIIIQETGLPIRIVKRETKNGEMVRIRKLFYLQVYRSERRWNKVGGRMD